MKEQRFVIGKGGNVRPASILMETAVRQFDTEVVIRRHRKRRSDDQNEALWGVAYKVLREETGNDPEDMHHEFCKMYFGKCEYPVLGIMKERPIRTTTTDKDGNRDVISTLDFVNFYDFIQAWSAENLGVYIPDPDPQWREKMEAKRA